MRPTLAGLIAYRRRALDVSRQKFAQARERDGADCETVYYLGVVLVERRGWEGAVSTLGDALACFDRVDGELQQEIKNILASNDAQARQAPQIARRERQLASNWRMRAASWFNIASRTRRCRSQPRRVSTRKSSWTTSSSAHGRKRYSPG